MVLFEVKSRQPLPFPILRRSAARRSGAPAASACGWFRFTPVRFLFIVMVTAEFIYAKSASALSPATEVTFADGQVEIPLDQVSDGDLHRFAAKENGVEVRFWLYQKPDGKVATVFDACEICGPVGFYKGPNGVSARTARRPSIRQSVGMPAAATRFRCSRSTTGRGHHQGNRRGGRAHTVRTEMTHVPPPTLRIVSGGRSAASCWPAWPSCWAWAWRRP